MIFDSSDLEYVRLNNYNKYEVEYVFDQLHLDSVYDIDYLLEDLDIDFAHLVNSVKLGLIRMNNGKVFRDFY